MSQVTYVRYSPQRFFLTVRVVVWWIHRTTTLVTHVRSRASSMCLTLVTHVRSRQHPCVCTEGSRSAGDYLNPGTVDYQICIQLFLVAFWTLPHCVTWKSCLFGTEFRCCPCWYKDENPLSSTVLCCHSSWMVTCSSTYCETIAKISENPLSCLYS